MVLHNTYKKGKKDLAYFFYIGSARKNKESSILRNFKGGKFK
jgi:Uri superfamily endonuclease